MRGWILRAMSLAFILVASGAASLAQAAHLVTFTRGQSIVVQSIEKRGAWYYFILDGGGEMGVLASQVARIEEYEAPPPPALASAPQQSLPAQVPGPETQASPGVNPAGPESGSAGANPQAGAVAPADDPAGNMMSRGGNDARFRAARSGGPSMQQGGGMRKPPGMGAGVGVGRIGPPNQYNRRTPPPQTGTPTQ
ncbi:MAG: hypothetical protein L0Z52_04775 [Acidobacteria bacterium]|nr:hypothetical protein [Acidobacteriota bacterium]